MARDYYQVLGIPRDAPEAEIKRAYRKLAMEHHPDRNNGDKRSEAQFKEATEAYEVLRDPERRARYDRHGTADTRGMGGFGGFHPDLAEALSIFMRDFGNMGGFDSIFGGGQRARRSRHAGADVRLTIRVTLDEVVTGTRRTIKLRTLERCETCGGGGAKPGTGTETCRTCGGVGEVRQATRSILGQFIAVTACPTCHGEGSIIREPCPTCRGDGRTRRERTVDLDIPPGVSTNNYLTMRGGGQAGPRGGPPGDLVAVLEVEDDPRFHRQDDDLVYDLPVSFSQAALGGEFTVPVPGGPVNVSVPAGTQSGSVITVRGSGLPAVNTSRRGDLHIRVRVWTPARVTPEMQQLFERLRAVEGEPPSAEPSGKKFWEKVREALGG
jgi:molecular chaperone DnaJ